MSGKASSDDPIICHVGVQLPCSCCRGTTNWYCSSTLASLQINKQNTQINNHPSSENNIWSTIQNSIQSDKWSNGKPNHEVSFAFIVYSIQMVQTQSNVPPVSYIINARCKDCVFFTLPKLYNLVQYTKVYWCVWIANLQPCLCNKLH